MRDECTGVRVCVCVLSEVWASPSRGASQAHISDPHKHSLNCSNAPKMLRRNKKMQFFTNYGRPPQQLRRQRKRSHPRQIFLILTLFFPCF